MGDLGGEGAPKPAPKKIPTVSKEAGPKLSRETTERAQQVKTALGNDRLKEFNDETTRGLREDWVDKLSEAVDPAIERAVAEGRDEALVIQSRDGRIDLGDPQGRFAAVWLRSLGAHATVNGSEINISPSNIVDLLGPTAVPSVGKGEPYPETGTFQIIENEGPDAVVVETDIDGVRIMLDGTAIRDMQETGTIRPMLLIKTGAQKGAQVETAPTPQRDNLVNQHDAINRKIQEIKSDNSLSLSERQARVRELQGQRDAIKEQMRSAATEGSPRDPNFKPRQKLEGEATDEELGENLTPEERISKDASELQRAKEEESRLIKEGASQEEIDRASKNVKELEDLLRTDQLQTRVLQAEKTAQDAIEQASQANARAEAKDLIIEGLSGRIDNLTSTVAQLISHQKEIIEASKMDEEKKKNLLAKLAEIMATALLGSVATSVKESGVTDPTQQPK